MVEGDRARPKTLPHCENTAPTASPLSYLCHGTSKDGLRAVLVSSSDLDFDKAEPAFNVP